MTARETLIARIEAALRTPDYALLAGRIPVNGDAARQVVDQLADLVAELVESPYETKPRFDDLSPEEQLLEMERLIGSKEGMRRPRETKEVEINGPSMAFVDYATGGQVRVEGLAPGASELVTFSNGQQLLVKRREHR